ncbi:MAG: hypothetical protein CFR70_01445 [Rhodocyclaceae bacterium]|nr:MAG: hypothetical protein CFR70_01445 [Rhodocyclaceae bacterium]
MLAEEKANNLGKGFVSGHVFPNCMEKRTYALRCNWSIQQGIKVSSFESCLHVQKCLKITFSSLCIFQGNILFKTIG